MTDLSRFDVVIVGAGPAGLVAADRASEHTSSIAVIDQGAAPGGQIWRRDVTDPSSRVPMTEVAMRRTTFIGEATVVDGVTSDAKHRLTVQQAGRVMTIETATLILATGARELFLPFPGWTLPGVFGVGGLQAMMKSGLDVRGRRVVIAGTGPLMHPVAATAVKKGAEVIALIEQRTLRDMVRFGARLAGHPVIAREALMYLQKLGGGVLDFGKWVKATHGHNNLTGVTITDGITEGRVDCDILATGYGLVPNTELARRLGCEITTEGIVVDGHQRTSIPGIYAAGECTGVAGISKATAEGRVAGQAATGGSPAFAMRVRLRSARQWGRILDRTFALRPELLDLAEPETIVCRCEDVRRGAIDPTWSPRQAKLYTRAGMGPCQGRVCGAALQHMFGWPEDTVRPPLQPATISSLLGAS